MTWMGLTIVILAGMTAGWLVDRMVVRLPLGRSLFWPTGSHCEACFGRLPPRAGIPILGYFLSRGRCPTCGAGLPRRRILLDVLICSLFVGLYALYFHGFHQLVEPHRAFDILHSPPPFEWNETDVWRLLIYHWILLALLLSATVIDWDWMIIPDSVTVPGMLLGVGLGTFWSHKLHPVPAMERDSMKQLGELDLHQVVHSLGGVAPGWIEPMVLAWNAFWLQNWNIVWGFTTAVAGLFVGGAVVWIVRAVCSWILRTEAIGFGDVTLMAMVGAFLGWQMAIVAFFLAPLSALVVGLFVWATTGNRQIPYGPHLSIASAVCLFFWKPIWSRIGEVFQQLGIFLFLSALMLVTLVFVTTVIQGVKLVAHKAVQWKR